MGEVVKFNEPYWKGFKLSDGKQRWMYTDEQSAIKLHEKDYFNKNTTGIIIRKGYETEENKTEPISDLMYYIGIDYKITNYFGDTSGMHFRSKRYVVIGDKIYEQLKFDEVKEVKRLSKELKGALSEMEKNL